MIESTSLAAISLPREQVVAYVVTQGAANVASRVVELLLAAGGPQAKFATVANLIADDLDFIPGVALEVRAFSQEVASLSPLTFDRLQHLAWDDCSDAARISR